MRRASSVTLAVCAVLLGTGSAAAQIGAGPPDGRSDTRGFTLGLGINRGEVSEPASDVDNGLGAQLSVGYGFSQALSASVRVGYGYESAHLDVGARYSLGSPRWAVRPYVEGALTRTGSSEAGFRSVGYGVTGGLGAELFVTRRLSVDVGASFTQGQYVSGAFETDALTAARVTAGVRWRP